MSNAYQYLFFEKGILRPSKLALDYQDLLFIAKRFLSQLE